MKKGDNKHQGNPRNHQGLLENLCSNQLKNVKEMNKFICTYNYRKLDQEEINNLNRSITCSDNESIIRNFPKRKAQKLTDSPMNFPRPLKKK
jgi:hypothetical protein